jgi:hypothetical protein
MSSSETLAVLLVNISTNTSSFPVLNPPVLFTSTKPEPLQHSPITGSLDSETGQGVQWIKFLLTT